MKKYLIAASAIALGMSMATAAMADDTTADGAGNDNAVSVLSNNDLLSNNDASQDDNSQINGNSLLSGNSDDDQVNGNSLLSGNSDDDQVNGNSLLSGNSDDDQVNGNSVLSGNTSNDGNDNNQDNDQVNGNSLLSGNSDDDQVNGNSLLSGNSDDDNVEIASRNSLTSNDGDDGNNRDNQDNDLAVVIAIDASQEIAANIVSHQELSAEVTGANFRDALDGENSDLLTGDIEQEDGAFGGFTGIATIAMDTSVGSINQAATNVTAGAEISFGVE